MNQKYIVTLTAEEHTSLEELIAKGKTQGYRIRHAQILLKLNEIHLYYTQLRPKYQLEFRLFSPKCTTSLRVFQAPIRIQHELQKLGTHLLHHALAIHILQHGYTRF